MSKQDTLDALTGKATPQTNAKTAKATPKSAKVAQSKGFTAKVKAPLASAAKAAIATYKRLIASGKAPMVREASKRVYPMTIVAFGWGFTSNADANAKIQAVCDVLRVPGPNGVNWGLIDYASESFGKRQKCMGSANAAAWRAVLGKDGVYRMQPTGKAERARADTQMGNGKLTGDKPKAAKGKAAKSTSTPKRDPERSNGPVKVTVNQAIRDAAKTAERNAQRAANRAKVQAEKDAARAKVSIAVEAPSAAAS